MAGSIGACLVLSAATLVLQYASAIRDIFDADSALDVSQDEKVEGDFLGLSSPGVTDTDTPRPMIWKPAKPDTDLPLDLANKCDPRFKEGVNVRIWPTDPEQDKWILGKVIRLMGWDGRRVLHLVEYPAEDGPPRQEWKPQSALLLEEEAIYALNRFRAGDRIAVEVSHPVLKDLSAWVEGDALQVVGDLVKVRYVSTEGKEVTEWHGLKSDNIALLETFKELFKDELVDKDEALRQQVDPVFTDLDQGHTRGDLAKRLGRVFLQADTDVWEAERQSDLDMRKRRPAKVDPDLSDLDWGLKRDFAQKVDPDLSDLDWGLKRDFAQKGPPTDNELDKPGDDLPKETTLKQDEKKGIHIIAVESVDCFKKGDEVVLTSSSSKWKAAHTETFTVVRDPHNSELFGGGSLTLNGKTKYAYRKGDIVKLAEKVKHAESHTMEEEPLAETTLFAKEGKATDRLYVVPLTEKDFEPGDRVDISSKTKPNKKEEFRLRDVHKPRFGLYWSLQLNARTRHKYAKGDLVRLLEKGNGKFVHPTMVVGAGLPASPR